MLKRFVDWIDSQQRQMLEWVVDWGNINSGTMNGPGLARMADALERACTPLGVTVTRIPLTPYEAIDARGELVNHPLGECLQLIKRPAAPLRVFLAIHMDTVYPAGDPFQRVEQVDAHSLHGPGVTDAKGGLAVMIKSLEAFERSPLAEKLGWEVLINSDEEIGSPGSGILFEAAAPRNHVGLLFEPATVDGGLVSHRGGSGNFAVVIRGKASHVGRAFAEGRNAIVAQAELIQQLHALNQSLPGVIVNVGQVSGGGPVNVVPDLAICRFNIRTARKEDEAIVHQRLAEISKRINSLDGVTATLHGRFSASPKLINDRAKQLMDFIEGCGNELNLPIHWKPSGGVCDGNRLAEAGLVNIDTLGPVGGEIHSPREFLKIDSLAERAKLTTLILLKLAAGDAGPFLPL